jgi:hypothetical protein
MHLVVTLAISIDVPLYHASITGVWGVLVLTRSIDLGTMFTSRFFSAVSFSLRTFCVFCSSWHYLFSMLMHVQLRIPLLAVIYLPEVHCDPTHYVTFLSCSNLLSFTATRSYNVLTMWWYHIINYLLLACHLSSLSTPRGLWSFIETATSHHATMIRSKSLNST